MPLHTLSLLHGIALDFAIKDCVIYSVSSYARTGRGHTMIEMRVTRIKHMMMEAIR